MHRLEIVVFMDAGSIVEVGVLERLLGENGSVFKGLWDNQHDE